MPARKFPIDIDLIILFELARGAGSGPDLWCRACQRLRLNGFTLHSGAWYPALGRLYAKGLVCWTKGQRPFDRHRTRIPKYWALTEKGAKEARRLSAVVRALALSSEASA
jgi:DNA-binding PadR family transcriptional regulator